MMAVMGEAEDIVVVAGSVVQNVDSPHRTALAVAGVAEDTRARWVVAEVRLADCR